MARKGIEFDVGTGGLDKMRRELSGEMARLSDLAQLWALKRVATKSRTLAVRKLAGELNIPQKGIRKRLQVYNGTRSLQSPRVKLWAGTANWIKSSEMGVARAKQHAPAGSSPFKATMPSGHTGLFYRSQPGAPRVPRVGARSPAALPGSNDLPISEVALNVAPYANRVIPMVVRDEFESTYTGLYWRDFHRRVGKRKTYR